MFFERYETLCKNKGITVSKAADVMGINRASVTQWKNSPDIVPSGAILLKIANYFEVSSDYLLGISDRDFKTNSPKNQNIIRIAGRNGYHSERALTDDQLDIILKMMAVMPDINDLK